ncbi:MAG: ring-cleaving dioxygenase [Saprospiraceae bacterium]
MRRRKFLRNTISFSALIAFHFKAQTLASQTIKNKVAENCRFTELTLYTAELEDQFEFYSKVLELPVISRDQEQFTLKVGESILQFKAVEDDTTPFYHYAINIPSNKYEKAKKWLSEKTPLLLDGNGNDLLYFGFWDAHAMYFKDPSGNIGELIARHTLDNDRDGEFGISDLLCISEIGTPVEDPDDLAVQLKTAYDLDTLGEAMFIGDENGLFVAVPVDRLWFPEFTQKADIFPTEIYISDKGKKEFQYQDYPYRIKQKIKDVGKK